MDQNTLTYFLLAGFGVVVFSMVFTVMLLRKRENQTRDERISQAVVKHPMLLNPALIAYVLFPIAIVVGAYIMYSMLYR